MSRIRFLLDENTAHAIGDQLRRRQSEIEIRVNGMDPALLPELKMRNYG